jgi:hypothetical protein
MDEDETKESGAEAETVGFCLPGLVGFCCWSGFLHAEAEPTGLAKNLRAEGGLAGPHPRVIHARGPRARGWALPAGACVRVCARSMDHAHATTEGPRRSADRGIQGHGWPPPRLILFLSSRHGRPRRGRRVTKQKYHTTMLEHFYLSCETTIKRTRWVGNYGCNRTIVIFFIYFFYLNLKILLVVSNKTN